MNCNWCKNKATFFIDGIESVYKNKPTPVCDTCKQDCSAEQIKNCVPVYETIVTIEEFITHKGELEVGREICDINEWVGTFVEIAADGKVIVLTPENKKRSIDPKLYYVEISCLPYYQ